MKSFAFYFRDYFRITPLKSLLPAAFFTVLLILLNYTIGIERRIKEIPSSFLELLVFFIFYSSVVAVAWWLQWVSRRGAHFPKDKRLLVLLLLAPAFFSLKMIHWDLSFLVRSGWSEPWKKYILVLLQLPLKLALLLLLLYACRKWELRVFQGGQRVPEPSFYGLTTKNFNPLPYFVLLLFLVPVIAFAATQHDFLQVYPKVKNIAFINGYARPAWPWQLLYELSYGLDFVSIELFFRGFLVIGVARWAGADVLLPMAVFYCTIHFGKPLGECISSFFGGLALGVIALRTRSIMGGLMVHLGLAWMMEAGGWLGNLYF